jgi:hypothetical protein
MLPSPIYQVDSEATTTRPIPALAQARDTSPFLRRLAERSQLSKRWSELAQHLEHQAVLATSECSETPGAT